MCNINLECVFFSSRMMIIIKTYLGHWVGKKHHGSLCRERPAVAWRCACFLFVFPNSTGCFLSQRVFFFLKPHFLPWQLSSLLRNVLLLFETKENIVFYKTNNKPWLAVATSAARTSASKPSGLSVKQKLTGHLSICLNISQYTHHQSTHYLITFD